MKWLLPALVLAEPPAADSNPLTMVIKLLTDLEAQGKADLQTEAVTWNTYNQWCGDTQSATKDALAKAEEEIAGFEATIAAKTAQISEGKQKISDAEQQVTYKEADIEKATKVRQEENAIFNKEYTDYTDSIYACEKAIETLSAVSESIAGADATPVFAQLKKSLPSKKQFVWAQISSLLEARSLQAPAAVERSGGPIIELLNQLKDQFTKENNEIQTEEQNRQGSYDTSVSAWRGEVEDLNGFISSKKKEVARAKKAKGTAQKNKASTEASKANDELYLKETTAGCNTKAQQYEARTEARNAELIAVGEAITILKGEASQAGAAQSYGGTLLQKGTSFIQMRSQKLPNGNKLVEFLNQRSATLKSKVLAQLAMAVKADPFVKVRGLIQDLITRLQEETKADLEKKQYCDENMTRNKKERKELRQTIAEQTATKEALESEIASLTEQINTLNEEINTLTAEMSEAQKLRDEQKVENTKTIEETAAAMVAVEKAITVLSEMYQRIGGEAALLQKAKKPAAPAVFGDEAYTGMTGESTGVMGLLDVILQDVTKLNTKTREEEETATKAHKDYMNTSETTKATKTAEMRNAEIDKTKAQEDLTNTKADLAASEDQLATKKEEWQDLKKQCLVTGVSYEERNKKRQEEIQSLQEALQILEQMGPTF